MKLGMLGWNGRKRVQIRLHNSDLAKIDSWRKIKRCVLEEIEVIFGLKSVSTTTFVKVVDLGIKSNCERVKQGRQEST